MADGIILAIAGGPELLEKTQKKYFAKTQSKISKVRCYITQGWELTYLMFQFDNWSTSIWFHFSISANAVKTMQGPPVGALL